MIILLAISIFFKNGQIGTDDDLGRIFVCTDNEITDILGKIHKFGLFRLHHSNSKSTQYHLLDYVNNGILQALSFVELGTDERCNELRIGWIIEALVHLAVNLVVLNMLPQLVEVRDHTVVEHGDPLLLVNAWMRMLVWDAAESFFDAVEFVNLSKSCMQNTDIGLYLIQLSVRFVDVVEEFCEAIVLRIDVRLLLESVVHLSQYLIPFLIRIVITFIFFPHWRIFFLLYLLFCALRLRALNIAMARVLVPLQLLLVGAECETALVVREPLEKVRVLPLELHAFCFADFLITIFIVFCIILTLLNKGENALALVWLLALHCLLHDGS